MKLNGIESFYMDDKLKDTLEETNEKLEKNNDYLNIVLFGGRLLAGYTNGDYVTDDIDIQLYDKNNEPFEKIDGHSDFHVIAGVMEVPPPEDRVDINVFIEYSNLKVFLPSPEMLVISKLSTKRSKDEVHLTKTNILEKCNLKELREMAAEYKDYVINPDDPDLNFNSLEKIIKIKGLD